MTGTQAGPDRVVIPLFPHHRLPGPGQFRKVRTQYLLCRTHIADIFQIPGGAVQNRVPHLQLERLIRVGVGIGHHMEPQQLAG